jgi:putative peptidoglycan lipid II flippase
MVKKIFGLVNREIVNIHDAAYFLAFFTFLSQILGLARDRMLTHFFGAGQTLDTYYAAFRIPDLIYIAIGSFISVSIIIPFLQDKINAGKPQAKQFVDNLFSIFFAVVIVVCAIACIGMPYFAKILYSTVPADMLERIVFLSRILLLSPILLGIANLYASVTQVHKRFVLYAMCPIVYNLAIVLGIVFLEPYFGLNGVVAGVLLGALLQSVIQMPFLRKTGLLPDVVFPIKMKPISEVAKVAFPRTITLVAGNLALIVLVSLASRMSTGSIAIFNLSFNLQSVPMTIIGLSYSMAAFPILAKLYSLGEKKKFVETIVVSTKHIIFLSLPVVALFVVLRAQIVRVVLGSGNFSWNDTRLTAACLALFALSAVAQSLVMLFVRAYYAVGSTKKPLCVNLFSSLLVILLPFGFITIFKLYPGVLNFLSFLFKIGDVTGTEVIALPLGFTIATLINIVLFFFLFERDFKDFWKSIRKTLFQSTAAAVITGFAAYIGLNIFDNFFDLNHVWGIFLQGLLSGLLGISAGIYILHILESKEIVEVGKTLHRRLWKTQHIIVPEQAELK